ncbi:MAG: hypothetical protein LBE80_09295, partial [Deltaproteobacteria bacterium]|nr:hypothetical protein [Deltaproteobacteria bacterium]
MGHFCLPQNKADNLRSLKLALGKITKLRKLRKITKLTKLRKLILYPAAGAGKAFQGGWAFGPFT